MKRLILTFALVGVASVGLAAAQGTPAAAPSKAKAEATMTAKTHEVEAEIVSFDAVKQTLTIKGTPENKAIPVDAKAVASVKDLKLGEKVTLLCRDNEKGEHQGVAGVKPAPKK